MRNVRSIILILVLFNLALAGLILGLKNESRSVANQTLTTSPHPWPMFHGDAGHTGFANVIGPKTAKLAWRVFIGAEQGNTPNSVAIARNGTIYVAGAHALTALDQLGKITWQTYIPFAQGPAISSDGTIYVAADTSIVAVNPDGQVKWVFKTDGRTIFGPTIAPDDTIYQGSWDHYLYALNPNGQLKWKFKTAGAVSYPPSLAADGTIYLGGGDAHSGPDRYVYALDPRGRLKWKIDTGAIRSGSPVINADETIIYAPASPSLIAITADGQINWSNNQDDSSQPLIGIISPAIGSDGTIYLGNYLGKIIALDPASGKVKWSYQTPPSLTDPLKNGLPSFPIVDQAGTVYVGSVNGQMYAISKTGQVLWSYQTGGKITEASPALGPDGTFYFTSEDGYLYAIK